MINIDFQVAAWQTIAEFPKYEMNQAGDVRDIDTQIRVEVYGFNDGSYVELMREGKPYLQKVQNLHWKTFPTGANPPLSLLPCDVERHGAWDQSKERYADGEVAHMCGKVCSVGVV